jgi:monovalent cation:H+ antiporter-2, CPA2 family
MPHESTLIATIATAFVLAFALGFLASKLRIPPLVGYLLAGVLIGPFTPGFIADFALARQLAEVGVILIMFGVGLHFSVKDLMAVRGIAIPGAIAQMLLITLLGASMAVLWGWGPGAGFIFGLSLSVASTVVLLRALEQRNAVSSPEGRVAVGWLIVQDLMMVIALVLLPALAGTLGGLSPQADPAGADLWMELVLTLAKVAVFIAFALIVGTRAVPWVLMHVARTGSRELFTLAVLAVALGIAFGSAALFGVSFSLGAFFAGVILSESDLSHKAAEDSLPFRDAFAVLFFVSVGMLFDPTILLREPLAVFAVLLVIVIGNSVAAFLLALALRYPLSTALTLSAGVAQIGEFSFILAALGVNLALLPEEGRDLILAGSILSITLNPLIFAGRPVISRVLRSREGIIRFLERLGEPKVISTRKTSVPLHDHAVIVGHGRVGGAIAPLLQREGLPFIVIERDRLLFENLQRRGVPAVYGDATARGVLDVAQIASARLLIVASPDGFQARRILELARIANPHIETVVRTHSEEELTYLQEQGVGLALMGERELARGMGEHVLRVLGVPPARAHLLVQGESAAELAEKAERL